MSYTDSDDEKVSEKAWELLKILEILNFRVYVLPGVTGRSDSGQSRLFYFAHSVCKKEVEGTSNDIEILKYLEEKMIAFTKDKCSQKEFVESLTLDKDESGDYYHWQGIKYFLSCYEQYLQSEAKISWDIQDIFYKKGPKSNDKISREHVWAQNHRVEDFPKDYIQKRRLGNFALMGLANNISLSDGAIEDKSEKINDPERYFQFMQVQEIPKLFKDVKKEIDNKYKRQTKNYCKDLSTLLNDRRETKLIKFALEHWKLEDENPEFFVECDSSREGNEVYVLKVKNEPAEE